MMRILPAMVAAVCLSVTVGLTEASSAERQPGFHPMHSHNDYYRDRPFDEAYAARARSIEVDVFPEDGRLLVAHDRHEMDPKRTIDLLYIDPISRLLAQYGAVYPGQPTDEPLVLLVDFKGDGDRSLDLLIEAVEPIREHLAFDRGDGVLSGSVLVIVSGHRPRGRLLSGETHGIFMDGRLTEERDLALPGAKLPLVSARWWDLFTWDGVGEFPRDERRRLRELVARVHANGGMIRFWAAPDVPACWELLAEAGVDLINTDRPSQLASFFDGLDGARRGEP